MNEVSKNQSKELVKKEERQAEIERLRKIFVGDIDFSDYNSQIGEFVDLLDKKKLTPKEEKMKDKLQSEISKAFGLKNGIWAANVSYHKYNRFLANTRSMLVKEYDCKAPIELMLADRIVASYWRSMRLDTTLNCLIEEKDGGYSFNDSKMNVIRELSKGLESASRQLNTSILLLKELKQPKLNVKVNTENAFIGQNQQFNVNRQNDQQQNEIIEPK